MYVKPLAFRCELCSTFALLVPDSDELCRCDEISAPHPRGWAVFQTSNLNDGKPYWVCLPCALRYYQHQRRRANG